MVLSGRAGLPAPVVSLPLTLTNRPSAGRSLGSQGGAPPAPAVPLDPPALLPPLPVAPPEPPAPELPRVAAAPPLPALPPFEPAVPPLPAPASTLPASAPPLPFEPANSSPPQSSASIAALVIQSAERILPSLIHPLRIRQAYNVCARFHVPPSFRRSARAKLVSH